MEIIGQHKLLKDINTLIDTDFPRFIILVGENGSGRKTIANYIATKLKAPLAVSEIKVEEVRNTINRAYKIYNPITYLLPNAEKMHKSAKNALLKVTEEPPSRAYFIFTTNDFNRIPDTLISRAFVLKMDSYTDKDKKAYLDSITKEEYNPYVTCGELDYLVGVCDTFLEIDMLIKYGISEFKKFCEITSDFIIKAPLANALKIPQKLKLKEDAEGYDPQLFLKSVAYEFTQKLYKNTTSKHEITNNIRTTLKYISELNITGINKLSTIDAWILELRGL